MAPRGKRTAKVRPPIMPWALRMLNQWVDPTSKPPPLKLEVLPKPGEPPWLAELVEVEVPFEESVEVDRNGLEVEPPAAVARSSVVLPIWLCWAMDAERLSEAKGWPIR